MLNTFKGEIFGYGVTYEDCLWYINQLAENFGYENLESLSLCISQEPLLHSDSNNDIILPDIHQAE